MFHLRAEKKSCKLTAFLTIKELKDAWKKKNLTHLVNDISIKKKTVAIFQYLESLIKMQT